MSTLTRSIQSQRKSIKRGSKRERVSREYQERERAETARRTGKDEMERGREGERERKTHYCGAYFQGSLLKAARLTLSLK